MTTRRRAVARAGVVMVLALGVLGVASPAFADSVGVTVTSQFVPFNPGGTQPLKITVTGGGAPSVTVSVSGLRNFTADNPQGCNGSGSSCTVTFGPRDRSKDISFSLTATGNVDPGQSKTDHGQVGARQGGLLVGSATAGFDVTLTGSQTAPAQPTSTVPRVSGLVKDTTTGSPLKGAVVAVVDTGACARDKDPCQVATDDNGAFTFVPAANKPITPGTLQIGATKSGYGDGSVTVNARAGQPVTVSLALKPNAAASSSANPDALASTDGQQPTTDAVAPAGRGTALTPAGDSGPSAITWIVSVLAVLLVLLGLGTLALMLVNRRKAAAVADQSSGAVPGAGPEVDGGEDPTMAGTPAMTSVMAAPGVSDPTAIVRLPHADDEFPDPYAAAYPASPAIHPQTVNGYGAPADPYTTPVDGYRADQPAGSESIAYGYGGAYPAYGQGDEYGAGYGGLPAGYSPDSYGSGGRSTHDDEAARHWTDGADSGYPGSGVPAQRQGDYDDGHAQQYGDYDPPAGYRPSENHDSGGRPRHDEAARDWDDGYTGGGVPWQRQGDYGQWRRHDQDYPDDRYDDGSDPYRQQQPTRAPAREGGPQARHGGDRQQTDWFGN